jgi:hypothetical protein
MTHRYHLCRVALHLYGPIAFPMSESANLHKAQFIDIKLFITR